MTTIFPPLVRVEAPVWQAVEKRRSAALSELLASLAGLQNPMSQVYFKKFTNQQDS
jgi:hypothetical protein